MGLRAYNASVRVHVQFHIVYSQRGGNKEKVPRVRAQGNPFEGRCPLKRVLEGSDTFRDENPHPLVIGERVGLAFGRKQHFNGDLGCLIA